MFTQFLKFSNKSTTEKTFIYSAVAHKRLERDKINRRRPRLHHRRRRQPRRKIRIRTVLVRPHVVLEIERVAQRVVAEISRRSLAVRPLMVVARDLDSRLDAEAPVSDLELQRGGFEPLVRRFGNSLSGHRFRRLNHRVGGS